MVEIEYTNQYGAYVEDVNCDCFRLKKRKKNIIKNHTDGLGQLYNKKDRWDKRKVIKYKNPSKFQIQNKIVSKEIKLNVIYPEPIKSQDNEAILNIYVPPKEDEIIKNAEETEGGLESEIKELIQEETSRGISGDITEALRKIGKPNLFDGIYKKDDPYLAETHEGAILSENNIQ